MSIESFRTMPGEDISKIIRAKNTGDRINGKAFSLYHSLALILKDEGADGLRHRKKSNSGLTDPQLNHAAIVFGVSMRAIELAFKNGEFDSYDLISYYNEAVVGARRVDTFEAQQVAAEELPKTKLDSMGRYSKMDKTHAIFFVDYPAYRSLPDGLLSFISWTGTKKTIKEGVIPIYNELAKLITPVSSAADFAREPLRSKIPSSLSPKERESIKQWEKMWYKNEPAK